MRNLFLTTLLLTATGMYGQDTISVQPKMDRLSGIKIKDDVSVHKSGVRYSPLGKTYTEIYEVVTDSIVHRFGLEFRSSDSTFIRRVFMDDYNRAFYDMLRRGDEQVRREREKDRKATVDFLNRYNTSPEVWFLFMKYKILK